MTMLHARSDYDAIQDPRPDGIADDEPVFIVRAKDRWMPFVVRTYIAMAEVQGNDDMVACLQRHMERIRAWQRENLTKEPDVPRECIKPL